MSARRFERFARERGLIFEREPAVRRSPAAFRRYDSQTPVGGFVIPGATGFEVGQRVDALSLQDSENSAVRTRRTWAAFALRPGAIDSAGDAVTPILPGGWHADVIGDELLLWTTRRVRLISPKLWSWLERAHAALEPHLARSAAASGLAARQRRGIRHAIEK